jgi:outer membrane lipoprotein-sorting protein
MRTLSLAVACSSLLLLVSEATAQDPGRQPQVNPGPGPAPAAAAATSSVPGKPAEPPQEPPTEAERLIDEAIKKLAAVKSVTADLVQNVEMLKQRFDIKGRFLKAPTSRIYLKLTISGLPDASGTLLQVCDGDTLWDYQQILDSQAYRKLRIKPIFERLNSPDIDPKTRDMVMTQMGFAGPETLLLGLRKSIKFDQKEEGELDKQPVWILRGTWRNRNGLVGPDQRPLPPTGPLPAFVPSIATLYLSKESGWPYKIVLVGKVPTMLLDTRRIGPDGRPVGRLGSIERVEPSRITYAYLNVQINPTPPIRPEEFAFQAPPNAQVDDSTEAIIKGLDQAIQMQAMQKRAEAARQDGPVLDQAIDIPKPPSEPTPK